VKKSFDMAEASAYYGLDVACPAGEVLTLYEDMAPTETRTFFTDFESQMHEQQNNEAMDAASQNMVSEIKNGGLCFAQDGKLMVTASCRSLIKLQITN